MDALRNAIPLDPVLGEVLRTSASDFFRGGGGAGDGEDSRSAERRHLEWFLAERSNAPSEQQRIELLLARCAKESGVHAAEWATALEGSHASLFQVESVEPGGGFRLLDLAGPFECSAVAADDFPAPAVGDVIGGRVFPLGDGFHHVSRAAVAWRNAELLAAVRADFERARLARTPSARQRSTLGQSEIEAILRAWRREVAGVRGSPAGAVARARAMFLESGLSREDADEFLEWLAREAPDPARILPGGDDVLRDVLDALAFETSVDLDAARMLLIDAWDEMHSLPPEPTKAVQRTPETTAPPADVASAIAEFDRKRREGTPVDQAIADLEHDLDLEGSESSEEAGETEESASDLPGVVGGVVEEFLWEEELLHGPEKANRYQVLRGLAVCADRVGNIEDLGRRELTDFACRWAIESGAVRDPEAAEVLLEGLERFCRWAEENHDLSLHGEFAPVLAELRRSLPRVALANRACSAEPLSSPEGSEWLEFVERRGTGDAVLADLAGKRTEVEVSSSVLEHLHPGDWVRGRREVGRGFRVEACYPTELRTLLES
jgi:hypothetical protein